MKYFIVITFLVILTLLNSCNNQSNKSENIDDTPSVASPQPTETISEDAYSLLQTRCLICHTDKNLSHDQLIAPPMAAVKNRYTSITDSKEEFIHRIVEFTLSPTVDEAVMYGAVRRFNLMAPVVLPEDTLRKIAAFLYESDISAPDWFAAHYKKMHPEGQPSMSLSIVEKVQEINNRVQNIITGQSELPMAQNTFEALKKLAEKVEATGEKESLQHYHQLVQALKDMTPEDGNTEAVNAYLEALQQKMHLMQNVELKEEAEFILLHIRRQLQMLDQHFKVK